MVEYGVWDAEGVMPETTQSPMSGPPRLAPELSSNRVEGSVPAVSQRMSECGSS